MVNKMANAEQLDIAAEAYVQHLLKDGSREPIESRRLALPEWYSEEKYNQGRLWGFYYQGFLFGMMLFGSQALLAIESVLNTLELTKQSNTPKMAYKRYLQTIGHISSWYKYGLKPGSIGWKSMEYVRNAHVKASEMAVKAKIGQITQKDMVLTQFALIGFGLIEADKTPNVDPRFFESTIAVWRLIGYLLGIKDEYNICTDSWETSKRRFYIIMKTVLRPALENPGPKLEKMTRAYTEGLRSEYLMSHELSCAIVKHKSGCKGYKTLNETLSKLGAFDGVMLRLIVLKMYLYRFFVFQIIFNVIDIVSIMIRQYLPIFAMIQFGPKWAYTRVFKLKTD